MKLLIKKNVNRAKLNNNIIQTYYDRWTHRQLVWIAVTIK